MPRWARRRLGTAVMSWPNSETEPAVGRQFAGDQVEQRRLAGAVRADDQPPFAGLDVEVDVAW